MLYINQINKITAAYRHFSRFKKIINVLIRYGFEDFFDSAFLKKFFGKNIGETFSKEEQLFNREKDRGMRFRMALEELGPTYIKLGQILSTRPDLIPEVIAKELEKLQDSTKPFSYIRVRQIIKEELGKEPDELFKYFCPTPLAAASIGQIHKAILHTGEKVIVKVQRPLIQKMIQVDLEIMHYIASVMEHHFEELEVQKPTLIVEEFAKTLNKEVNFELEAAYTQRFGEFFMDDPTVYVPKIFKEYCSERVLTEEFINGIKISQIQQYQEQKGINLHILADNAAKSALRQIFDFGFFHADPHPGNIFVMTGNVICYLDFGMVGRLSDREKNQIIKLLYYAIRRDDLKLCEVALEMLESSEDINMELFQDNITEMVDEHLFKPIKEIDASRFLQQFINILRNHKVRLKANYFLMVKSLLTAEKSIRTINPEFDVISASRPFVERAMKERFSLKNVAKSLYDPAEAVFGLLASLPKDIDEIVTKVKKGKLKIEFEHRGLENFSLKLHKIVGELSMSVIIAAVLISSSLVINSNIPPLYNGVPVIGIVGFVLSFVISFILILTYFKNNRKN